MEKQPRTGLGFALKVASITDAALAFAIELSEHPPLGCDELGPLEPSAAALELARVSGGDVAIVDAAAAALEDAQHAVAASLLQGAAVAAAWWGD